MLPRDTPPTPTLARPIESIAELVKVMTFFRGPPETWGHPADMDPERMKHMISGLEQVFANYKKHLELEFPEQLAALPLPNMALHNRFADRIAAELKPEDPWFGRKWYASMERLRSGELERHFDHLLKDAELPQSKDGAPLRCLDVGSRSNFFAGRMFTHERQTNLDNVKIKKPDNALPSMEWCAVDVAGPLPPARAMLVRPEDEEGKSQRFAEIDPNADRINWPLEPEQKPQLITLNCVLHHVGEKDNSGKFDDNALGAFLDKLHDSLADDGVVVAIDDFIGQNTPEAPYEGLIKGVDALFYPKALGNQKPVAAWQELFTKHGFSIQKTEKLVGYNVLGLPVVEVGFVLKKVPHTNQA